MTVFGIVNDIPFIIGHCVMLGLLLILIVLEYAVEYLDVKAEQYNITLLLVKLKKELMFMGIISFVVFVYSLIAEPSSGDSIYSSFEMSHMIFFFMAIAFLFQALFLTSYSTTIGRTFIMALRKPIPQLSSPYNYPLSCLIYTFSIPLPLVLLIKVRMSKIYCINMMG